MAESFYIDTALSKEEKYKAMLPQAAALVSGEKDIIANMANIAACLRYGLGHFWVGFYLVKENQLVLGPFQGPVACTRIPFSKGVCGACYTQQKTLIVPDVEQFPGHIACSSDSKSEIVVPVYSKGEIIAVLDVDSDQLNDFDDTDKIYLEQLVALLQ